MSDVSLSELLEAATPGPWKHEMSYNSKPTVTQTAGSLVGDDWYLATMEDSAHPTADAALIVALVNAAPALLALWKAADRLDAMVHNARWLDSEKAAEDYRVVRDALRKAGVRP